MKTSRFSIVLCGFAFLVILQVTFSAILPKKSYTHRPAHPDDNGIWKKHIEWKARFVKEWREKKILVPVWRKVWGPIEINEWIPLPKVPHWHPH